MPDHTVDPVDEKPPLGRLLPLGLQHVLVMYAGAVAVPLILGSAMKKGVLDADGEVIDVCVQNGQVVEFGQILFKLY